jgi:hypothetical protein
MSELQQGLAEAVAAALRPEFEALAQRIETIAAPGRPVQAADSPLSRVWDAAAFSLRL